MRRRLLLVAVMIAAFIPAVPSAHGVAVAGVLGDDASIVRWSGQFTAGATGPVAPDPGACSTAQACEAIAFDVGVPPTSWTGAPGGLLVAIQWQDFDAGYDLDLHIYRAGERAPVASSRASRDQRRHPVHPPVRRFRQKGT
jgi:hypothetical protein